MVGADILDIPAPTATGGWLLASDGNGWLEFVEQLTLDIPAHALDGAKHTGNLPWNRISGKPTFGWNLTTPGTVAQSDSMGRIMVSHLLLPEGGYVDGVDISDFFVNYLDHITRTLASAHTGNLPWSRISGKPIFGWDGTPGGIILQTDGNGDIKLSNLQLPTDGLVHGVNLPTFYSAFINHATSNINSAHSGLLDWARLNFRYSDIMDVNASGVENWLIAANGSGGLKYINPFSMDIPVHDLDGPKHNGLLAWTRVSGKPTFGWNLTTPGTVAQSDSMGRIMVSHLLLPEGGYVDGVDVSDHYASYVNHLGVNISSAHLGNFPWSRLTFYNSDILDIMAPSGTAGQLVVVGSAFDIVYETPVWIATSGNQLLRTNNGKIRLDTIEATTGRIFGDQSINGDLTVDQVAGTAWGAVFTNGSGWTRGSARYKRLGDLLVLRGTYSRSSGTGSLVATLPAGSRPSQTLYFMVAGSTGSLSLTANDRISLRIDTSGQIHVHAPAGGTVVHVSFDGIIFSRV